MEMPIGEFLDRYSIIKLKYLHTDGENEEEFFTYKAEFYDLLTKHLEWPLSTYFDQLYSINKEIWDFESNLRKGKDILHLTEVGQAAIKIRNANRLRKRIINELVDLTGEGFKDIKMNHASEEISDACSS